MSSPAVSSVEDGFTLKSTCNSNIRSSFGGKVLIALTGGTAIALTVISYPFIAPALRRICLPYVPATETQVSNVLTALNGRSGKLIDIGSGDGRIVISAAKKGFTSHGVELNPWLIRYSKCNALLKGVNSSTAFYKNDLWKFDLKPYNNIVIFGVKEMMNELECKIRNEVVDDTVIVACRFPFSNMKPVKIIGSGIDTVWCYKL